MRHITFPGLARTLGDVGLLSASFVAASLVVNSGIVGSGEGGSAPIVGQFSVFIALAALVLGTNLLSGVYSTQRSYPLRTKVLMLFASVVVGGALAAAFLLGLSMVSEVPVATFLVTWVLAAFVLPSARMWSWLYLRDSKRGSEGDSDEVTVVTSGQANHILVIGGAGYIGSALLPRLLERYERVRLLDVFMYGKAPIADLIDHPRLDIVEADYRDASTLVDAMDGIGKVVHLGGLVGDPACAWNEDLTVEVNVTFTRVIAEIAKARGVQSFVFASTCSVYGASDEMLNETSLLNPVSLYARSKIGSEQILHELQDDHFGVTILRFGTIYGLSGRTRFDLVVNLLTAKALKEGVITVFGGDQWRPFLHVDDAARAVDMVVSAPARRVSGKTFNVGSDEQNLTLGDVGRLINRLVPTAEYIDSGNDGDRRDYRVSFARIRRALGFTPEWTVEMGVQQVLDALASGTVVDYKDPRYSNVQLLKTMTGSDYVRTSSDRARAVVVLDDEGEPLRQRSAVG